MKLLSCLLAALVLLALGLTYAVYLEERAGRFLDAFPSADNDLNRGPREKSLPPERAVATRDGRGSPPQSPAVTDSGQTISRPSSAWRTMLERAGWDENLPVVENLRRTTGYVDHPRAELGFSRRALLSSGPGLASGPSAARISMRPRDAPTAVHETGEASTMVDEVLAESDLWWPEAPTARPGERILSSSLEPPHVELIDAWGDIHRGFLDTNNRLHYRAPGGAFVGIAPNHHVVAFNLAIDNANAIHLAWFEDENRHLYYGRLHGGDLVHHLIAHTDEPSAIEVQPDARAGVLIGYGDAGDMDYVRLRY